MHQQIYLVVLAVICLTSTTLSEISKKPNRFLTHIFNKYGSHGVINFEVSRAERFELARSTIKSSLCNIERSVLISMFCDDGR